MLHNGDIHATYLLVLLEPDLGRLHSVGMYQPD